MGVGDGGGDGVDGVFTLTPALSLRERGRKGGPNPQPLPWREGERNGEKGFESVSQQEGQGGAGKRMVIVEIGEGANGTSAAFLWICAHPGTPKGVMMEGIGRDKRQNPESILANLDWQGKLISEDGKGRLYPWLGELVMGDEMVMLNEMTRHGLRSLHVMRMGEKVERERWVGLAPVEARETVTVIEREEKEMGVFHLNVVWQAREAAMLRWGDGRADQESVWWWIGKSLLEPEKVSSLREAVDWAAMTFERAFGKWPRRCVVNKNQWKAAEVEVEGDGGGPYRLELVEEGWAPKGFVVVV